MPPKQAGRGRGRPKKVSTTTLEEVKEDVGVIGKVSSNNNEDNKQEQGASLNPSGTTPMQYNKEQREKTDKVMVEEPGYQPFISVGNFLETLKQKSAAARAEAALRGDPLDDSLHVDGEGSNEMDNNEYKGFGGTELHGIFDDVLHEDQPRVSYANKVTGSSMEDHRTVNFRYIPSPINNKGVDVLLSKDAVRDIQKRLGYTLYGYFLGGRESFPSVHDYVWYHWKKFGLRKIMMNAEDFFFFQFTDEKGMMEVLEGAPWMVKNQPLFLDIWNPSSKVSKKERRNLSVWVKIHGVPLAAYSDEGLSKIFSKIGDPVRLDSYTADMCVKAWGRSSYARAMVKIDASMDFKETISIGVPTLDGDKVMIERVKVEYEWVPLRCYYCEVFGHDDDHCVVLAKVTHEKRSKGKDKVNIDENDFVEVKRKKAAKKSGYNVNQSKPRFIYKEVRGGDRDKQHNNSNVGSGQQQSHQQKSSTRETSSGSGTFHASKENPLKVASTSKGGSVNNMTNDNNDIPLKNSFAGLDSEDDEDILSNKNDKWKRSSDNDGQNNNSSDDDDDVEDDDNKAMDDLLSDGPVIKGASTPSQKVFK